MIVKGNARGGGAQLAAHLMNAHDNERVELAETRGSIANDLAGAFSEWRAQSKATNCDKYLYSLSISPDQAQGRMERAHYLEFLNRIESALGLSRQGRVVVFHEKRDKDGVPREHCHAVWSRIDAKACRAVQLSHDRMKLRKTAQEFAQELGRTLPAGMAKDQGNARHTVKEEHRDLQEQQQTERSGISKEQRRATITKAWQQSRDGIGFAAALQDAGYVLAQGDKRAYVVIDRAGDVHSLSRQIEGARAKDVPARLQDSHPVSSLPSVDEARAIAAQRREALQQFAQTNPSLNTRRAILAAAQQARRAQLTAEQAKAERRQASERNDLAAAQRLTAVFSQGKGRKRRVATFVTRTLAKVQERHQVRTLQQRHRAEQRDIVRQLRHLTTLDKKEMRSLETKFKREGFQDLMRDIARREAKLQTLAGSTAPSPGRTSVPLAQLPAMPPAERQSRLRESFGRSPALPPVPDNNQAGASAATPQQEEEQRIAERLRRLQELKPDR